MQAFFDAGEHKDYILLSTSQGELQVTGSHIYATYGLPDSPGSVYGSFDSDCEVRMMDGQSWAISRNRKVVVNVNGSGLCLLAVAGALTFGGALPAFGFWLTFEDGRVYLLGLLG